MPLGGPLAVPPPHLPLGTARKGLSAERREGLRVFDHFKLLSLLSAH